MGQKPKRDVTPDGESDDSAGRSGEERFSTEELRAVEGTELPDRALMSTVDPDVIVPIDPAVVADVLAGAEPPEEAAEERESSDDDTDELDHPR